MSEIYSHTQPSWHFKSSLLLVVLACGIMFFAEKHFFAQTHSLDMALTEIKKSVIPLPHPANIDNSYEGKIVYVQGVIYNKARLEDAFFGVSADGLTLVRTVQYFQWLNSDQSKKELQTNSDTDFTEKNVYKKAWTDKNIDSIQKNNILILEVENSTMSGEPVTLGAYTINQNFLQGLKKSHPIPLKLNEVQLEKIHTGILAASERSDERSESIEVFYADTAHGIDYLLAHAQDNVLFLGKDYSVPRAGDVRMQFSAIAEQEVSLIARVQGDRLETFKASDGRELILLAAGKVSMQNLLQGVESSTNRIGWGVHLLCLALLMLGARGLMLTWNIPLSAMPVVGTLLPMNAWISGAVLGVFLAWLTVFVAARI